MRSFFSGGVIHTGDRWICIEGRIKSSNFDCAVVVVYGMHSRRERQIMWEELSSMRENIELPFIFIGDFNEVLKLEERKGGVGCCRSIEEFNQWVNSLQLVDLPLGGRKYTWSRGKSMSRLDRCLVDNEWCTKFPEMKLMALNIMTSDHCPIVMETSKEDWGPKPFRSLDAWLSHPDFVKKVKDEWCLLGELLTADKLKALRVPLRVWNKKSFGHIDDHINKYEVEIMMLEVRSEECSLGEVELARLEALQGQFRIWYARKESYWRQLAREKFVKLNDRNTKYFHAVALGRRRKKRILLLKVENRLVKGPRKIKKEAVRFFRRLYSQPSGPEVDLDEGLLPKLNGNLAEELEQRPSIEEIKEAVWSCDPSKAAGYDGFNINFIKKMWDNIGDEISSFVLNFFDTGYLPEEINMTWVVLIPKIDSAEEFKDFRLISMVGCLYKVIAKILARRLKRVMPDLIGEAQSVFVQNRQSLDGVLIANEVISWIKKRKKQVALLKLDFHKAYDMVKWSFVDKVLASMGFGTRWCGWIRPCISSISMSVLINGSPSAHFKLKRGFKQGDPISPFLFILVAEVLNRMILKAKDLDIIKGVVIGRDKVELTHLQFADDTLIFCPAKEQVIMNYRRLLDCFSLVSGLTINYSKSSVIPIGNKEVWAHVMGNKLKCKIQKLSIMYLGIPLGANPNKISTWKPVLDKVEKKLALWKAKLLFRAGGIVLIKAVSK